MNQVQWMKIREAEIIELLRCDSIVLAVKSTPTTARRMWKGTPRQSKYFSHIDACWFVFQMPICILDTSI